MDQSDQNANAAGSPRLVKIGDASYLATPLDDKGMGTLLDELKKKLRNPLLVLEDDEDWKKLSPLMQERAIRAAVELKTAGGTAPNGETFRKELSKPAGCAFLAWLMFRKEQPTVKLEDLRQAITEDNVSQVLADLYTASGLDAAGKAATGATGS